MRITILCILTLTIYSCNNHKAQNHINPLLGSWKMQKVTWLSAGKSYPIENTQAGIFLFTTNSYSIQWTPTEEPRKAFVILSKPTDEELKSGFKSVVFNAGSYQYNENTVTTTAYIAKVPGFEGGKQYYTYKIIDDILTITMFDESYPDGSKPDWSGKYKTQFTLKKI